MPTFIIVVVSLFAAAVNAGAALLQRQAAGTPEARELFRKDFALAVTKNRLWLGGLLLQVAGGVLQAVALYRGSLVLVEPLLTTDLIFLLVILNLRYRVQAGLREWTSVLLICAGLSSLLIAANPRGGAPSFEGSDWFFTSAVVAIVVLVGIFVIRRSASSFVRAGIGGVTAGVSFAFAAGLTKLVMEQVDQGFVAVAGGWELYALLIAGALSILVAQSVYAAGPLAISQPAIEISDPLFSAIIGMVLFGDIISTNVGALFFEVLGAVAAAAGIAFMGTSKRIIASET